MSKQAPQIEFKNWRQFQDIFIANLYAFMDKAGAKPSMLLLGEKEANLACQYMNEVQLLQVDFKTGKKIESFTGLETVHNLLFHNVLIKEIKQESFFRMVVG